MGAFRGTLGLVAAAAVVLVLLLAFPAYRWFFLISLGIGVAVWAILHYWHSTHPIEEKDVQNPKRPLGLS